MSEVDNIVNLPHNQKQGQTRHGFEEEITEDQVKERYPFITARVLGRWRVGGLRFWKGPGDLRVYALPDLWKHYQKEKQCQSDCSNTGDNGSPDPEGPEDPSTDTGMTNKADKLENENLVRKLSS